MAGPTERIEKLVTPKDEKKKPNPRPKQTTQTNKPASKSPTGATKSPKTQTTPKSETKPGKPRSETKPEATKTEKPKANPLARFLVKMKPGAIPPKPKERKLKHVI